MKTPEFKTLLIIQIITLILVSIIFFNNLSNPNRITDLGVPAVAMVKDASANTIGNNLVKIDAGDSYVFGNQHAPNFLIVFSNYNCDFCRYFYNHVFDSLKADYIEKGKLKIICKELVDPVDKMGMLMAKIAEVAKQTKHFPAMHKLLINIDDQTDSLGLIKLALKAGITETEIKSKLNSPKTLEHIQNDYASAKSLNISGTPSFVLNGQVHPGYITYKEIDLKLNTVRHDK
jgi:protein-disulfide isomerase